MRGALYGTTRLGGVSNSYGTVFSVTTSGSEAVVHVFGAGSDGAYPWAGLTTSGYGTTNSGGMGDGCNGCGTVYRISSSGKETVLHGFGKSSVDGNFPLGGLISVNGTLYGTTDGGGIYQGTSGGGGAVYSITSSGSETLLHSFGSGTDGASPQGALLEVNGTLYGTTYSGGTHDVGTVFSITPSGTETVLYSFKGGPDGSNPSSGLIKVGGALYGTTAGGGYPANKGTIFKVTLNGTETVLHSFFGGQDGSSPQFGSLLMVNKVLYGTTSTGGTNNLGTVYSITPSGVYAVVYSFRGGSDGANPEAGLINVGGVLYGTTNVGGASNDGTVFALTP